MVAGAVLIGAADLFSFELFLAAALFLAGLLLYKGQTTQPAPPPRWGDTSRRRPADAAATPSAGP